MVFSTTEQLLNLPQTRWLIRHILPAHGLNLLYGPSGHGKSFVAIDWALSICTGLPWLGEFKVDKGHVVYIASEGGRGIQKRVAAWMEAHGFEDRDSLPPNISWYLDILDMDADNWVDEFMEMLQLSVPTHELNVKLIVIDTLSRNFGGQDENATDAMTNFVTQLEQFCKAHEAAVLLVHHTNAMGKRERGNSALRASMESVSHCYAVIDKEDQTIEVAILENNKQKDSRSKGTLYLKPVERQIMMLPVDEDGNRQESIVWRRVAKPVVKEEDEKSGFGKTASSDGDD